MKISSFNFQNKPHPLPHTNADPFINICILYTGFSKIYRYINPELKIRKYRLVNKNILSVDSRHSIFF